MNWRAFFLVVVSCLLAPISSMSRPPMGGSAPSAGPPPSDLMATLIAANCVSGQWCGEFIALAQAADPSGTHHQYRDNIPVQSNTAAYMAAYCHGTISGGNCNGVALNNSNDNPWNFSAGIYLVNLKKYLATVGGHLDWPGSEVEVFDINGVNWSLTDTSAQYDGTGATIGSTCPNVPWSSGDAQWKPWCNSNGRFAGVSKHSAGGNAYSKSTGLVYAAGYSTWGATSAALGGLAAIVASTGQYQDPPTVSQTNHSQLGINNTTGYFADVVTNVQCTGCNAEQIFIHGNSNGGGPGNNVLIDASTGTITGVGGQGSGNGDCGGGSMGTLIPDQINGSPFVAYITTDFDTCTSAPNTTHVTIQPKINLIPNGTNFWVIQSTSNTMPSTCGIDGNESWLYMGNPDFGLTGNHQAVVFSESCKTELKIIDVSTANPTWGAVVSIGGTQPPAEGNTGSTTKRFWFDKDHKMFWLFENNGHLYGFQCPSQVTGC